MAEGSKGGGDTENIEAFGFFFFFQSLCRRDLLSVIQEDPRDVPWFGFFVSLLSAGRLSPEGKDK